MTERLNWTELNLNPFYFKVHTFYFFDNSTPSSNIFSPFYNITSNMSASWSRSLFGSMNAWYLLACSVLNVRRCVTTMPPNTLQNLSFGNLGTESPFGAYKRVLPQYPFLVLAVSGEHWNSVHQNRERKRNMLDWEYAGLGFGGARRRERGGAVGLQECSGPRGETSAWIQIAAPAPRLSGPPFAHL